MKTLMRSHAIKVNGNVAALPDRHIQFRVGPIGRRLSTQRQPFPRKELQSENLFTKYLTGGFVMYML